MFPLSEALGEMPLPLSLEIVGTDLSQFEAGRSRASLRACRSVTNDSPILGRLLALLACDLYSIPGSVFQCEMVVPVVSGGCQLQIAVSLLRLEVLSDGSPTTTPAYSFLRLFLGARTAYGHSW